MQNILITGGSGLIGRHVIDFLLNRHNNIYALYNSSLPALIHEKVSWTKCDLQKEAIQKVSPGQINAVIHCAAMTPTSEFSEETCYDANRLIDHTVLDFCRRNTDIKIAYLSSIYIQLYPEHELKDHSKYLYGKWQSEEQLKNMKNKWGSFRISSPYGIHQKYRNVFKRFMEKAIKRENLIIHGTGNRTQDFISADDVAEAIIIFLQSNLDKVIFNICSSRPVSMSDLAHTVKLGSGQAIAVMYSEQPDSQENYRANFDNSVTKKILRWHPRTSLENGVREWFKFLQK